MQEQHDYYESMRKKYRLNYRISTFIVNATIATFLMSFAYLVGWCIFHDGFMQGLTYEQTMEMNSKRGFSKQFIDGWLFSIVTICLLGMMGTTWFGYKEIQVTREAEEKTIPAMRESNELSYKSANYYMSGYGFALIFFFGIYATSMFGISAEHTYIHYAAIFLTALGIIGWLYCSSTGARLSSQSIEIKSRELVKLLDEMDSDMRRRMKLAKDIHVHPEPKDDAQKNIENENK